MAHLSKQEVINKIRNVLSAHGAYAKLSTTPCNPNEINIELGMANIDNDQLIDDLNSILWNDTSDVEICPCREVFARDKNYL